MAFAQRSVLAPPQGKSTANAGVKDSLMTELETVLSQNFTFDGSFYHASTSENAPNPCLQVADIGLVGLPLSQRDAQAVISTATLAPFGHGEKTVIDKTVRNTWEIEPTKLSFTNPAWSTYLRSIVLPTVAKSLGVKAPLNTLKLDLYKLLLYESGSHFLPHQDTQKAKGMFATVVILLPSPYTGGEVVVQHSTSTKTVDLSSNSTLSTSILAWYTDVRHEVKPIKTGYRLALSFNLIHLPSSGNPASIPSLPSTSQGEARLCEIFQKWKAGGYSVVPKPNLVVYLLEHEYSIAELRDGIDSLKGVDAHKVHHVLKAAEAEGVIVGEGLLQIHRSGSADDDGDCHYRRNRRGWGYEEPEREGTPEMLEVDEETIELQDVVGLDNDELSDLSMIKLDGTSNCFIPKKKFDTMSPDETDYEGYMGNGAGTLEQWYRRAVLILLLEPTLEEIKCRELGPIKYGLIQLSNLQHGVATAEDLKWINMILREIQKWTPNNATALLDYAIKFKDDKIWAATSKSHHVTIMVLEDPKVLSAAWSTFGFEKMRLSFELALSRSTQLHERIKFLNTLASCASAEERQHVRDWVLQEKRKVLASYPSPAVSDIPTLLMLLNQEHSAKSVDTLIVQSLLQKPDIFEFWAAFLPALASLRHKSSVSTSTAVSPNTQMEHGTSIAKPPFDHQYISTLIQYCFQRLVALWNQNPPYDTRSMYMEYSPDQEIQRNTPRIKRIMEVMKQCFHHQRIGVCALLLKSILQHIPPDRADYRNSFYTPLIPHVIDLLSKNNHPIHSAPFSSFFQILIGYQLHDIPPLGNVTMRRFGCGCQHCQPVNAFLHNVKKETLTIGLIQARRRHVEAHLGNARDLLTFTNTNHTRPVQTNIAKTKAAINEGRRPVTQEAARRFLTLFYSKSGSTTELQQLMGPRWIDVLSSLKAEKAYALPTMDIAMPSDVAQAASSSAIPLVAGGLISASALNSVAPALASSLTGNTAIRVGQKRKIAPTEPIIDLTLNDSD